LRAARPPATVTADGANNPQHEGKAQAAARTGAHASRFAQLCDLESERAAERMNEQPN